MTLAGKESIQAAARNLDMNSLLGFNVIYIYFQKRLIARLQFHRITKCINPFLMGALLILSILMDFYMHAVTEYVWTCRFCILRVCR